MRTFGIWAFGLLGSGIVGGLIGGFLDSGSGGGIFGFLAGLCAFACVRLWLRERREQV